MPESEDRLEIHIDYLAEKVTELMSNQKRGNEEIKEKLHQIYTILSTLDYLLKAQVVGIGGITGLLAATLVEFTKHR